MIRFSPLYIIILIIGFISCNEKKSNKIEYEEVYVEEIIEEVPVINTGTIVDELITQSNNYIAVGVDLGLPSGTIWSFYNLGASDPFDRGEYFILGQTTPWDDNLEGQYKDLVNEIHKNRIYIGGDQRFDAATSNLGFDWRTPTDAEFWELKKECNWKWIVVDGKKGYLVTGPNGNSIFLPAAGIYTEEMDNPKYRTKKWSFNNSGYYWYYETEPPSTFAGKFHFKKGSVDGIGNTSDSNWDFGAHSIRPVSLSHNISLIDSLAYNDFISKIADRNTQSPSDGEMNNHGYIDLGLPSGTLWAINNIGADRSLDRGDNFAWGKIEANKEFDKSNYIAPSSNIIGNPKYDAAKVHWGGEWQMPSLDDFNELVQYCVWTYIYENNKEGYFLITGPNKKKLILPSPSNRDYWSGSQASNNQAFHMQFRFMSDDLPGFGRTDKYISNYIRPVIKK